MKLWKCRGSDGDPCPYTLTKLCLIQTQMGVSVDFSTCPISERVALLCGITTPHLIRSISSTTNDLETNCCKGGSCHPGRVQAIKGIREKVQLATKFANVFDEKGNMSVRGDPEYVRSACEASLKRLDVDCIDLYYQHRVDTKVPIEITVSRCSIFLSRSFTTLMRPFDNLFPPCEICDKLGQTWRIPTRSFEQELVGESAGRGNEGVGGGRKSEVLGSFGGFSK